MLHYYLALPKERSDIDFEKNIKISFALGKLAQNALTPFYQYLKTAIESVEKKEEVEAIWEKYEEKSYEIEILGEILSQEKFVVVEFELEKNVYRVEAENIEDIDQSEPIKIVYNGQKETKKVSVQIDEQKQLIKSSEPLDLNDVKKITWDGERIELLPRWLKLDKGQKIKVKQDDKEFNAEVLQVEEENGIGKFKIKINGLFNSSEKSIIVENLEIYDYEISNYKRPRNILKETEKEIYFYKDNDKKFVKLDSENSEIKTDLEKFFGTGNKQENKSVEIFDLKNNHSINVRIKDFPKVELEGAENIEKIENRIFYLPIKNNDEEFKLKFRIRKIKQKEEPWIIIKEKDEEALEDKYLSVSPLKYFFDDDIKIKDDLENEYIVYPGKAKESEYRFVLAKEEYVNGKKRLIPVYPEGKILKVKINTYQLRKQLEAVITLQNMPIGEHRNLIKLFEKREIVKWENFRPAEINQWNVLTDDSRSGINKQREFVKKALATPDFALLEGPPGSGKTTVILELITQIISRGGRVLLCGSTHVAIDNVLERLKQQGPDGKSLIEKFNILPVRIGDVNRISEEVKEFQLNEQVERLGISEDLLLDVANLVCGTTIGILQHPKFKKRKPYYDKYRKPHFNEPIIPEFDYLIIDESSKTTFQEFLVPALYAKRWILVGDVLQLSPFTDREIIEANLENLVLKNGVLDKTVQKAVLIIHKILEALQSRYNKFILVVSQDILEKIQLELEARSDEELMSDFYSLSLKRQDKEIKKLFYVIKDEAFDPNLALASDVIFITKSTFEELKHYLPETHAVLFYEDWEKDDIAFKHSFWSAKFSFKDRGRELNSSFEIVEKHLNSEFKERTWAGEITWRLIREYELRLVKNSDNQISGYKKVIQELIPKQISEEAQNDLINRINTIATIALPSVLEALIKGIKGRRAEFESTLTEGFSEDELSSRHVILEFQHRMHPQISGFSRKHFYQNRALKDLKKPRSIEDLRYWTYDRYPARRVWINVHGKTEKNYNLDEVKVLLDELKKFLDYAERTPHPLGEKWTVAVLTFYRGQEKRLREKLQKFTGLDKAFSNFYYNGVHIKLHTVDKFQGQEADVVFLSMVQTKRVGFMDNINRLNVAITRARFQLVIIGNQDFFKKQKRSEALAALAKETKTFNYGSKN